MASKIHKFNMICRNINISHPNGLIKIIHTQMDLRSRFGNWENYSVLIITTRYFDMVSSDKNVALPSWVLRSRELEIYHKNKNNTNNYVIRNGEMSPRLIQTFHVSPAHPVPPPDRSPIGCAWLSVSRNFVKWMKMKVFGSNWPAVSQV